MKKNINKNLKLSLIILITIIIGIISFLLYRTLNYTGTNDQKVPLYKYNNKSNINYSVFLKPNILYDNESIGAGNAYITEFIDYIKASFNYQYSGDKQADIQGAYEIIAEIEGFTGEGESYKTIWKKESVLLPKKNFDVKDKNINIKEDISLNLETYNDFVKKVIEDSKVGLSVKLKVFMNVNLKAKTDKGIIEEKMSPAMEIPLNTSIFTIVGNLKQEKPGVIEETVKVQLPVNKKIVMVYSFLGSILLIILIFLVFFTKATTITDPLEKKLKKIFKNYGDRLVALNTEAVFALKNHNEVTSIEDLVRIADEIGKPIMYKYSLDFREILKFYVFDEAEIYVLDLTEKSVKQNIKDSNKEVELVENVHSLRSLISELDSIIEKEEVQIQKIDIKS